MTATRTGGPDGTRAGDDSVAGELPELAGAAPTVPGRLGPPRPAPLHPRDPARYDILGEHGRGGLGRVLRARDRDLGRPVAIKELLRPTASSELRFLREALITARLEHPSIVPVHEAGRWPDGTPFYAMKLVAGRPLKSVIDAAGSLERRLALLPHVIAVADAIAYAHAQRIIHRDLKPSNVLVGDFGETVVIDWGLAKDLDDPDGSVDTPPGSPGPAAYLTVAGTVMGTPGYMPPEQERGIADERSDIYALGALLLHVVDGRAPRGTRDLGAARMPAALLAIITKAMAADPSARYATARQLADDLRDFQGGRLVGAHRYSFAELLGHWASRHRRTVAVAAIAAALLAVTLVISARRVLHERTEARAARDETQTANAALVLTQARSAAVSNPTKALLWLRRYAGDDVAAAQDTAVEAMARGVARHVLDAHRAPVTQIVAVDDRTLFSSARSAALTRWTLDGAAVASQVIAEPLDVTGTFDYHRGRHRLVHTTAGGDLVVRDPDVPARVVGHLPDWVAVLEIAPDGSRAVAGTLTGDVILVDLDRPAAPIALHRAGAGMRALGYVDDAGRDLLLATEDGTLTRFDGRTGQLRSSRRGPPVIEGTTGRAGRAVVVHADGTASVIAADLSVAATITIPAGCLRPALSHGASMLAFTCRERTAVLSLPGGALLLDRSHTRADGYPVFSPDDRWLAIGTSSGAVHIASLRDGAWHTLVGHVGPVSARLAFVGDTLASGDELGELRLWPLPEPGHTTPVPGGDLRNLAVSRDGTQVASTSDRGVLRLWSSDGGLRRELRGHVGTISSASFMADGAHVVTAGFDGTARVWPTAGDAAPVVLRASITELKVAVGFGDDVLTLSEDGRLRRWNLASSVATELHRDPMGLTTADVRAERVVFAGDAGVVREYDHATGRVDELARHVGAVVGVRYTSDGSWVVSAGVDGVVRLTARRAGLRSRRIVLPAAAIAAQVSPDGRLLAVASDDRQVRIYALGDGEPRLLTTREASVRRMRFAPVGQVLAVAGLDGVVRVWDLATGESVAHFLDGDAVGSVDFVEGGAALVIATPFRLVRVPLATARRVPATVAGLRELSHRLVPIYQRPRRATLDERLLFSSLGH